MGSVLTWLPGINLGHPLWISEVFHSCDIWQLLMGPTLDHHNTNKPVAVDPRAKYILEG
jgi:hypothetical protein